MVTAEGRVEVAVEALKLGAADYIVDESELPPEDAKTGKR